MLIGRASSVLGWVIAISSRDDTSLRLPPNSTMYTNDVRSKCPLYLLYFDTNRQKTWLKGDSRSGSGSEVAATEATRAAVEEVFVTYGVTSILDAPCGDLTWMPFVKGIQNVRYTGADIAATVVEDNRRKFGQIGSPRAISDTIKVSTNKAVRESRVNCGGTSAWRAGRFVF